MFEKAKGEWKDNEWQSKEPEKEKWHGKEQWQAKHEKKHQKWQGKEQWQPKPHYPGKATNAGKCWNTPLYNLETQQVDDGFSIGELEDDMAALRHLMDTGFNSHQEKIRTIIADGIKQLRDCKQNLRLPRRACKLQA